MSLDLFLDAISQDDALVLALQELEAYKALLSTTMELLTTETKRADTVTLRLRQVMGFAPWNVEADD